MSKQKHLFLLGATGFVGKEVVKQAIENGLLVTILARSAERAAALADAGARVVIGDAERPESWIHESAGCDVMIDLLQPEIPNRVGLGAIRRIAATRRSLTERLLTALGTIAEEQRPLFVSVSGLDDLTPDAGGNVDDNSPLQTEFSGFAHIGVPVRRAVEASGVARAFAYLATVYGPGKTFATKVFPQLAEGRLRLPGKGSNRMGVVHVDDAARALVHIAMLERTRTLGRSFVIAEGDAPTLAEFMGHAAELLHGPKPKTAPAILARLFAGQAVFETMTRDIAAHPKALIETGFEFRYPTYRDGLLPSIKALGYPKPATPDKRPTFAVLAAVTLAAFLAEDLLMFPLSVPYMKALAAGARLLDMRPAYTPGAVYQLFDVLGNSGRNAYLQLLWSVDLLLPALFGSFLAGAIARGAIRRLRSLPLLAAACDYAENIAITTLLLLYPEHHSVIAYVAAGLTTVKLALYASSALAAVGGALMKFLDIKLPLRRRADAMR
jgi:NAD dependent epimerase/dehydratase family enzyme